MSKDEEVIARVEAVLANLEAEPRCNFRLDPADLRALIALARKEAELVELLERGICLMSEDTRAGWIAEVDAALAQKGSTL